MEITGKIVKVLPTLSGQGKNGEWVKNSFVMCLEVVGADKFEKMKNAVKVGYDVLCKFSVSSREWNGKYFTTAQCFYCSNVGGQQQTQSHTQAPQPQAIAPQQANSDDQLPF